MPRRILCKVMPCDADVRVTALARTCLPLIWLFVRFLLYVKKNVSSFQERVWRLAAAGHTCRYGVIEIPMFLSALSFHTACSVVYKKHKRATSGSIRVAFSAVMPPAIFYNS